jgi:hypothetical protein
MLFFGQPGRLAVDLEALLRRFSGSWNGHGVKPANRGYGK